MERILNKSKSRYFFVGKKKGVKDQGISSSDTPAVSSESRDYQCGPLSGQNSPSPAASPLFHAGDSVMVVHGHHVRNSPRSNDAPEYHLSKKHTFDSPSATPPVHASDHLSSSQSRFKVHINPNVFSPIMMPSSTPPRDPSMPSMPTAPPQHREFSSPASSKPSNDYRAPSAFKPSNDCRTEHTRAGEVQAHSRSQSALTPDQVLRSHVRMRRQGIPECFMQASAREMHIQNGNNSSAEHYTSDSLKSGSTPTASSNPLLTRPSTSVPVNSNLHNSQNLADLAPFRESSTVQAISSHTSLPRSNPSYNLSGFTPTPSAPQPPNRPTEVVLGNPSPRHHRLQPSRELDRPRRDTPPPFHPPPHSKLPEVSNRPHTPTRHYHTPNASMSSEKEMGYKGLAFPLPPSNDEGLAMPPSSQSSFSSVASGTMKQGTPTTPKKMQDGQKECDAKTPKSSRSATGSEKHHTADGRASPMLDLETIKKRGRHDVSRGDGTGKEGERNTTMKVQERVEMELESTLAAELGESGLGKETSAAKHTRATSEDNRGASGPSRALPQLPRPLEPTKPLSFTPGRKTLHTARSFSRDLNERKPLHTSASERDLSSSFNNSVNGRGERSKKTTAIPVRVVTQREVSSTSSQPDAQLPTPPNSSTVLSHLGREQKGPGDSMTLEDVTNALHAQRGRFEELAGYVVEVAQQHATERAAHAGRVGRLEGAIAKMEREIRGLRWLVLEHGKSRKSTVEQPTTGAEVGPPECGETTERKLRRSLTMPKFAKASSPQPTHARSKRDAIGLGLGFSPESVLSSLATLSPPPPEHPPIEGDRTPSMDEIIDKLMGVRQWATDVRVSVVDACETDGEGSKKIVFREP